MQEIKYNFLVDSHCHLKTIEERGLDLNSIVNNSRDFGVRVINNICANIEEADDVVTITEKYDNIFCSIGHHPEETDRKVIKIDDLLKYRNYKKLIGIGESGLDYYYSSKIDKNKQIDNFLIHIEAARELQLPLVIHSRLADEDMKNILQTEMKKREFSFVSHCFCSSEDLAMAALDLNGYISFSGILTFKNAIEVQSIAKKIPFDKILVETDAPYLAPIPYRGKINQPAYTKFTAEFLANLLNLKFEEVQNLTTENFLRLFNYKGLIKFSI